MQQLFLYIFSAPTSWGDTNCAGGFAPDGAAAFSAPAERGTRTASAGSPLTGGFFSAPAERGTRTALACSPLTGGKFFAEPQRGDSPSVDGGDDAVPTAVGKKEGTPAVSLPLRTPTFPLLDSLTQTRERRPLRKGERQRIFSSVSFVTCSQGQIAYCYTDRRVCAGAA